MQHVRHSLTYAFATIETSPQQASGNRTLQGIETLNPHFVSITRREPTPEQEAEILDVVDEERRAYAEERRH